MHTPDLLLLYVKDVEKSTGFYRDLLKREPKTAYPTYVAFGLDGGFTLGLWSTKRAAEECVLQTGLPSTTAGQAPAESGSRFELVFQVENEETVETMYSDWRQRGILIAQEPITAVFGRTFVGLDPDGHRIRVCVGDR